MAENEKELNSLLIKLKEESGKAGLKLNIQKTKIMASSLITSWQTDGETMETVVNFILLGSKINPKGNQPWIFTVKTDAEAEAPILWPSGMKSRPTGKDPDAGKDWGQEKKRAKEDEMIGWHHQLNGHESEQTPGDSEGQGSLAWCSSQGHKESDMT